MRKLRSVCVIVVLAVILGAVMSFGVFADESDKYKPTPPPTVALIPYYVFKYDNYDAEINVDGRVSDLDIDPAAVHIIGFDIEFGAISIGAMLDMLNNANRDLIMISFTYNLDYNESKASSAPAPKEPQRGRAGK